SLCGIDSAHGLWRPAGLSTVVSGALEALTVSLARSYDLLVRLSVGVAVEFMHVISIIERRVTEGNFMVHTSIFRAVRGHDDSTVFEATGEQPHFVQDVARAAERITPDLFEPLDDDD